MRDSWNAAGLRSLHQRLQDTDAESVRAEFVLLKYGQEALGSVWDAQSLVGSPSLAAVAATWVDFPSPALCAGLQRGHQYSSFPVECKLT